MRLCLRFFFQLLLELTNQSRAAATPATRVWFQVSAPHPASCAGAAPLNLDKGRQSVGNVNYASLLSWFFGLWRPGLYLIFIFRFRHFQRLLAFLERARRAFFEPRKKGKKHEEEIIEMRGGAAAKDYSNIAWAGYRYSSPFPPAPLAMFFSSLWKIMKLRLWEIGPYPLLLGHMWHMRRAIRVSAKWHVTARGASGAGRTAEVAGPWGWLDGGLACVST